MLDTLFPMSCLACGQEGSFLCLDCKSALKQPDHQRCIVCQKASPFGLTHPGCQTPYGADDLISFYDYHDERVAKILIKGKYSFLPEVYKILGGVMAGQLASDPQFLNLQSEILNLILVPIPLHTFRLRWRGFNQSKILCEELSGKLGLPVIDALIRKKSTKTQKDLKREARLKNIRDAFTLSPHLSAKGGSASMASEGPLGGKSSILNHTCLLVDDVTTTGATLQEAAKILKRAGAAKVICLTVARD